MNNFWQKLNKPFYAMAPMAGITDSPFRQMCKRHGADVLYSEMASAAALFFHAKPRRNPVSPGLEKPGFSATLELLKFEEVERPFVVQLFGSQPEHFAVAVRIVEEKIRPDGIDINFGCPVKKVQKQGAGAVLMRDLKLSREIIKATIDSTSLPVSIKTRTKVGAVDVLRFLENVNDLDIKAIMIHGRTFNQLFSGPVDLGVIKKARDYFGGVIMANGGIALPSQGGVPRRGGEGDWDKIEGGNGLIFAQTQEIIKSTGADGLGIGRGALGRPWIFEEMKNQNTKLKTQKEIFDSVLDHAKLMVDFYGEKKGILEMRKHLAWYVQGHPGARRLRRQLVEVESVLEIERVLGGVGK